MWACVVCHKRKVKCDRAQPCANCIKNDAVCEYQAPPKPRRSRKTADDLLSKIKKYEDHLKKIGANVDDFASTVTAESSSSAAQCEALVGRSAEEQHAASPCQDKSPLKDDDGALVVEAGRSRYLENNLWLSVQDELQHSSHAHHVMHDQDDHEDVAEDGQGPSTSASNPGEMLLFGQGAAQDPIGLYPPAPVAMILWRFFLNNVHPLTKMIHAPTVEKYIQLSCQNVQSISRSNLTLLFAIHFKAVNSMSEDDCQRNFGRSRSSLYKKYLQATQLALIRAAFLRTSDFTILTAYSLYLLAIRGNFDAQTHWALCGIAMRVAQRLGLHHDVATGLKPFEIEMRRRVWKQILILDWAASEVAGSTPSHTFFMTWWNSPVPTNINDSDFGPNDSELPPPRVGATEMIFCLLRYEFGSFFRLIQRPDSGFGTDCHNMSPGTNSLPSIMGLADRDRALDDFERMLEQKCLCYCDPIIPLHQLTSIVARSAVVGMRLRTHHPRQYTDGGASLPEEEKQRLFGWSLKALQYDNLAYNTPTLRPYLWHISAFYQFHALIYILVELRSRCSGNEVDQVWSELEMSYRNRPELCDRKHVLHTAIGLLALHAWDAREAESRRLGLSGLQPPEFITKLRSLDKVKIPGSTMEPPVPNGYPLPTSMSNQWNHRTTTIDATPPSSGQSTQSYQTASIDWAQWDNLLLNPDMPLDLDFNFNNLDPLFMPPQP